jgi:hypothetical protein
MVGFLAGAPRIIGSGSFGEGVNIGCMVWCLRVIEHTIQYDSMIHYATPYISCSHNRSHRSQGTSPPKTLGPPAKLPHL